MKDNTWRKWMSINLSGAFCELDYVRGLSAGRSGSENVSEYVSGISGTRVEMPLMNSDYGLNQFIERTCFVDISPAAVMYKVPECHHIRGIRERDDAGAVKVTAHDFPDERKAVCRSSADVEEDDIRSMYINQSARRNFVAGI